jgi:hypothetical protein
MKEEYNNRSKKGEMAAKRMSKRAVSAGVPNGLEKRQHRPLLPHASDTLQHAAAFSASIPILLLYSEIKEEYNSSHSKGEDGGYGMRKPTGSGP